MRTILNPPNRGHYRTEEERKEDKAFMANEMEFVEELDLDALDEEPTFEESLYWSNQEDLLDI